MLYVCISDTWMFEKEEKEAKKMKHHHSNEAEWDTHAYFKNVHQGMFMRAESWMIMKINKSTYLL